MTDYRPFPKPATELPWSIVVETRDYRPDIAACHIWTAKGPGYGMVATTAPWCQPYDKERQDAAYILTACNAFPHLVAALEKIYSEFDWHDATVKRALAIARGEAQT